MKSAGEIICNRGRIWQINKDFTFEGFVVRLMPVVIDCGSTVETKRTVIVKKNKIQMK